MRCLTLFVQAAEQAKASPALVAKDPATSTNKKEEEDLAKGGCKSVSLRYLNELREVISLARFLSDRTVSEGPAATAAASGLSVWPLPEHQQPPRISQG